MDGGKGEKSRAASAEPGVPTRAVPAGEEWGLLCVEGAERCQVEKMVEIQVSGMLAARRLLLDGQMNPDKPRGTFPSPSLFPSRPGNFSITWRAKGRGGVGEIVCWEPREGAFCITRGSARG